MHSERNARKTVSVDTVQRNANGRARPAHLLELDPRETQGPPGRDRCHNQCPNNGEGNDMLAIGEDPILVLRRKGEGGRRNPAVSRR